MAALFTLGFAVACSSSDQGNAAAPAGMSGGSTVSSGGAAGSGGKDSAGGVSGASAGAGGVSAGGSGPVVHGGPGCGLAEAAFCETFDAPSTVKGRAVELDPKRFSAGRLAPQLPSGNGCAIGIGPGTLPACRAGLPAEVFPDQDTLVCDPTEGIADHHLLVVAAAQNYGQNAYRIRQPFDFADRTGKIVFDADGSVINGLLGWISLEVTEDPIDAPCFSVGDPGKNNNEGSLVPRNAVEIQFQSQCGGYSQVPAVTVSMIDVISSYADTVHTKSGEPTCVETKRDHLNHFEVSLSRTHVQVTATPYSADGKAFGASKVLFDTDVDVPFSRGWVQISTHNHATLKYSGPGSGFGAEEKIDAWTTRWDNVGFDGPVLANFREYEIPDSLTDGKDAWNRSGPIKNVGYRVPDAKDGPSETLHFEGVDVTDVTSARLSLSAWYLNQGDPPSTFVLHYRLNGKTWHDRMLTAGELALITGTHTQGQLGQMLDVPVEELVSGDNSLEFTTSHVPQNYPPVVANIDLVLTTK